MLKIPSLLLLLLSLRMLQTLAVPDQKFVKKMYRNYQAKFGKNYKSTNEATYRAEIFEQNLQKIQAFNKETHGWNKGENMFTDMTPEERRSYLGYLPTGESIQEVDGDSFPKESDDTVATTGSEPSGLLGDPVDPFESLPQKINWLTGGIMTPIKHQGACGSCWSFTTTALVESLYKQKYGYNLNLSEQELVDCATTSTYTNFGCNGGYNNNALNYYKLFGSHTETQYPYKAKQGTCARPLTAAFKVATVTTLKTQSLVTLLTALTNGPVATAYFVADDFYDYDSGIYNHKAGCIGATNINHAVLAVGYDLNAAAPYIMFKNSWGTNFGENGYFRMSMDVVDAGYGPCNLLRFTTSANASL